MPQVQEQVDLFYVTIQTANSEVMGQLLREYPLDYGCRPNPVRQIDGSLIIQAMASLLEIEQLRQAGFLIEVGENATELARQRIQEVGRGDRFEGGQVAPRGLGLKVSEQ
jgi:hypothetical protein